MKRLVALMLLMSVFCLGAGRSGCRAQIKPVNVGGGPGIAVVLSEEDHQRIDEGISKLEEVVGKLADVLPVVASVAKLAGDLSGNKDFEEKADDFADTAEKGAASLGLVLAISGLIRGLIKKEDS